MKLPVIKRGMIQTALGSIFYLISDGRIDTATTSATITITTADKPPILCFHMSPRSSDEYVEVLPLLALGGTDNDTTDTNDDGAVTAANNYGRVVIAFDLPGYGASENPPRSCTVDEISDACLAAADSILGTSTGMTTNYVTIGSLLGNFFCVSLASRYPERIRAGILTNPWYNPRASGMVPTTIDNDDNAPLIPDSFHLKDDGSHLVGLHSKRSSWLDNELNLRVVQSEIEYLANRRKRYAKGINIEGGNDYDFSSAVQTIVERQQCRSGGSSSHCKILCIRGEACANLFDAFGLDGTKRFDEACELLLPAAAGEDDKILRVATVTGDKSTLNVVNQMPEEFAALCNRFLSSHGL